MDIKTYFNRKEYTYERRYYRQPGKLTALRDILLEKTLKEGKQKHIHILEIGDK